MDIGRVTGAYESKNEFNTVLNANILFRCPLFIKKIDLREEKKVKGGASRLPFPNNILTHDYILYTRFSYALANYCSQVSYVLKCLNNGKELNEIKYTFNTKPKLPHKYHDIDMKNITEVIEFPYSLSEEKIQTITDKLFDDMPINSTRLIVEHDTTDDDQGFLDRWYRLKKQKFTNRLYEDMQRSINDKFKSVDYVSNLGNSVRDNTLWLTYFIISK